MLFGLVRSFISSFFRALPIARASGENAPVPAAQPGQNYHFSSLLFRPVYNCFNTCFLH